MTRNERPSALYDMKYGAIAVRSGVVSAEGNKPYAVRISSSAPVRPRPDMRTVASASRADASTRPAPRSVASITL
jgi:hypothetical protein